MVLCFGVDRRCSNCILILRGDCRGNRNRAEAVTVGSQCFHAELLPQLAAGPRDAPPSAHQGQVIEAGREEHRTRTQLGCGVTVAVQELNV